MNIAVFSWEFPPFVNSGLGRYIEYYTNYITQKGNTLLAFGGNLGTFTEREKKKNMTIYRPKVPWLEKRLSSVIPESVRLLYYNFASFLIFWRSLKEKSIDVISVHDWMSCFAGVFCSIFFKIPVVFHVHSTEFTMAPWRKKNFRIKLITAFEKRMAKLSAKIIVPSDEMLELLSKNGWDREKIVVIKHGFKPHQESLQDEEKNKLSANRIRERFKIRPDEKVLLFVGRLVHAKGVFNLIHAMKKLVKTHPELRLILVGTGENQKVELMIRELGLSNHINAYFDFLPKEEVLQHYNMADVCVFPSLYEPFGLVALEAMSCGKPVLLGKGFPKFLGGPPENPAAIFVDGEKPALIADGIKALLETPCLSSRLGSDAKEFVHGNFDWNRSFLQTLSVYRQASNKAAGRNRTIK